MRLFTRALEDRFSDFAHKPIERVPDPVLPLGWPPLARSSILLATECCRCLEAFCHMDRSDMEARVGRHGDNNDTEIQWPVESVTTVGRDGRAIGVLRCSPTTHANAHLELKLPEPQHLFADQPDRTLGQLE